MFTRMNLHLNAGWWGPLGIVVALLLCFAPGQTNGQTNAERAAEAAFQRGQVAEQELRWPDAADHFAEAARLAPTFERLYKARELAREVGRYQRAWRLAKDLLARVVEEHGEGTARHARALNELALLHARRGLYAEAEPLYHQAMEITKAALGEGHPDYANRVNNLAVLYFHMERFKESGDYMAEALAVFKSSLGADRPNTKAVAKNYAFLRRRHFPDDPKLAKLEAAFGPDIGK